MSGPIEFALGLIGIGKPWGYVLSEVPGDQQVRELLERAYSLGVRYFDTAPSYGVSEARLSAFLASLTAAQRRTLRIATKFGEHWDAEKSEPFVDHSYAALARSLDESLARLGRIDILQLHKTTPDVLRSPALARAWEYARKCGIPVIGASVSDLESAAIALSEAGYGILQLPYNRAQTTFGEVIEYAAGKDCAVAVNRPFGMGRMLYENREITKVEAFRFILAKGFRGAILSGTKSPEHLEANWRAFQEASAPPA